MTIENTNPHKDIITFKPMTMIPVSNRRKMNFELLVLWLTLFRPLWDSNYPKLILSQMLLIFVRFLNHLPFIQFQLNWVPMSLPPILSSLWCNIFKIIFHTRLIEWGPLDYFRFYSQVISDSFFNLVSYKHPIGYQGFQVVNCMHKINVVA